MARADIKAGAAYVELYVKNSRLMKGLQDARQRLQSFGSGMQTMGRGMLGMSAAIAAPIGLAVKVFADFDDAMRSVGAAINASDSDLAMLTESAKELGRTTSFTALDVASLMGELGRAGFNPAEVDKMTASVLNLARATGTDATLSAGIMNSTLRQFGLGASDAARVSDVLTAAANMSFTSVEGLGESLKYAGPVAGKLGMSLEETAAVLGTLGNVGILGSQAGTTLTRLSVISAAELGKLEKIFGVSLRNSAGAGLPLIEMLSEITNATANLDQNSRIEKMNEAFGLMGITGALAMGSATVETNKLVDALNNSAGIAEQTALKMDAGLGGAFRILMSAAEGVALAVGEAVSGAFSTAAKIATTLFGEITKLVGENKSLVTGVVIAAAVLGSIGAVLFATGLSASIAAIAIGGLIGLLSFGASIVGGIMALGSALFSIPGIIAMIGAVVLSKMGVFANFRNAFTTAFSGIWETAKSTFGVISSLLADGQFAMAGQAAMLGLRIAMMQGLDALYGIFGPVGGEIMSALVTQISNGDLSAAWETAIVGLAVVWESFANALGAIWTDITGFITTKWQSTVDGLTDYLLQNAAEGGIFNAYLKATTGVDFAEEVKRQEELNRQMKAAGMNTESDSGFSYKAPSPSITDASDDQSVVDRIKGDAAAGTDARQASIDAMKTELAAMQKKVADKVAGQNAADPTAAATTAGAGTAGASGGVSTASVVTSSAAALMAAGRGGNTMASDIKRLVKVNEQANKIAQDAAKEMAKTVASAIGIPVF